VSLCRFHHRRHHQGRFEIRREGSGDFNFTAADGKPILPPVSRPATRQLARAGPAS
jgi:hypothetical protein